MKDIDDQSVLHTERLVNVRIPALSERYLVKQGDILFRSREIEMALRLSERIFAL